MAEVIFWMVIDLILRIVAQMEQEIYRLVILALYQCLDRFMIQYSQNSIPLISQKNHRQNRVN